MGNTFFNRLAEVASRFDANHIHEHHVFAEVLDQVVKQTTGLALRVATSIADKDGAHALSL